MSKFNIGDTVTPKYGCGDEKAGAPYVIESVDSPLGGWITVNNHEHPESEFDLVKSEPKAERYAPKVDDIVRVTGNVFGTKGEIGRVISVVGGIVKLADSQDYVGNKWNYLDNEIEPYTVQVGDRVKYNTIPAITGKSGWGAVVQAGETLRIEADEIPDGFNTATWWIGKKHIDRIGGEGSKKPEPVESERKDWTDLVERTDMLINAHKITGGEQDYTAKTLTELRDALIEESYR